MLNWFNRITITVCLLTLLFALFTNVAVAHHLVNNGVTHGTHTDEFITDHYLRHKIRIAIKGDKYTQFTQTEIASHNVFAAGFATGQTDADDSTALTKITSLEGLQNATNMTSIFLGGNNVTDLSQLSNLANLSEIALRDNENLSDISGIPIVAAEGTLASIRLDGCPITSI